MSRPAFAASRVGRIGRAALFGVIVLSSCVTLPPKTLADFTTEVSSDNPLAGIMISVVNVSWNRPPLGGEGAIAGIVVRFENRTGRAIRVDWGQSSVSYEGQTFVPFLEGMKYADAGKSPAPVLVAEGAAVSVEVHSSAQPHDTAGKGGGWYMRVMSNDVRLVLCVEQDSEKHFFTVAVMLAER